MKINRRDFLMASALMLTSGKILTDVCMQEYQKDLLHRIYYELPKHIHKSKNVSMVDFGGKGSLVERVQGGYGIVLNGKYIQPAHITHDGKEEIRTPFEVMIVNGEVKERKITLYDKELEIIKLDYEKDVGIFKLHKDLDLKDFPCKPKKSIMLGEEVYLIGNPNLSGTNIRKGRISDLDGIHGSMKKNKNVFGMDLSIHYGDSGCPIVNKDFELFGLADSYFGSDWSYATKIREFL